MDKQTTEHIRRETQLSWSFAAVNFAINFATDCMRSPSSAQISVHCVNQASVGVPIRTTNKWEEHRDGRRLTFRCMLRDQLSRLADEQHGVYSDHEGAYFKEDRARNLGQR